VSKAQNKENTMFSESKADAIGKEPNYLRKLGEMPENPGGNPRFRFFPSKNPYKTGGCRILSLYSCQEIGAIPNGLWRRETHEKA
jgi:hypothetical protein